MLPNRTLLKLIAGVFASALLILVYLPFVLTVASRAERVEQDLDQKFLEHRTLQLDARTVSQQVRDTGRLSLATSDLSFDLELVPHDLRAAGYRAEEFGSGGVARPLDIGAVRTFKGHARGTQHGAKLPHLGEARFTINDNSIDGLIVTPSENYFIEPAGKYSKEATATDYVIYKESDVVATSTAECAMALSEEVNQKAGSLKISSTEKSVEATASLQELRIATEADSEYVDSKGGPSEAAQSILSILNQVEGLYEIELGLTFRVVYQSTWKANDPYESTNASELLGELTKQWNGAQGSVARDVMHMWTGKQLDNGTIGIAYLEALCRIGVEGRAAYGLSKGVSGLQQIAITAHEIGHNLGTTHPNQHVPPVTECDNTVMSSSVGTNPRLTFCQTSVNEIAEYIDKSAGCLSAGATKLGFGAAANYPVGSGPTSVTSSDLNGDSRDDLVVANSASNNVSVLLGKDDGTLMPAVNYAVGTTPIAVVAGDFNGDGKQDLASANEDSNNISVLIGTGTGVFEAAVNHPLGSSPRAMTSGDFNEDGRHDIAVTSFGSSTVAVLLGTNAGSFQSPTFFPVGNPPFDPTVSDFNNDNKQDLAISTVSGISVLLGTGTGGFQAPIFSASSNARLAVGDFNNDGNKDVITFSNFVSGMIFLLGTGTGSFQSPVSFPTALAPSSVGVRDFNDDGRDDLAVLNLNIVTLMMGVGPVNFQSAGEYSVSAGVTGGGHAMAVGDFNGDGKDDLAVASRGSQLLSVLLGAGGGVFQGPSYFAAGLSPSDVAVGDFNNDGRPDIAMSGAPNGVSVLLNTSTGTGLQAPVNFPAESSPAALAVSDFNADGAVDIVVANGSSGSASVLLGTGTGAFQPTRSVFVGAGQSDVAVGDFNLDGKPDLAMSLGGNTIGVLLGMGTGDFISPSSFYPVGSFPIAVAVGDFNGDGRPDLAIAKDQSNNISVLIGTGTGEFQSPVNYSVGSGVRSIAVGDFNDDGKQDCAVANITDSTISVLLAKADGTFESPVNYVVASNPIAVVVDDFNGDHREDIATANFSGSTSVLLGTGSGTFLPKLEWFIGVNPNALSVGDFNIDGKPDLVLTDSGQASLTLLLNTSGASLDPPFNDDFGAARVITKAMGTIGGTSILATKEPGELNHAANSGGTGGASIWYRWKAPSKEIFHFQTFSSSFPTAVAVYTGSSLNSLFKVAGSSSNSPEYVEFQTEADTTYHIVIDGINGDTGRTVLNWNTGSLTNDNFASAREIRGSSGSVSGNNTGFTLEPGEPTLPGLNGTGFSAWYKWTAPNTGKVIFFSPLCGTRLFGAYTGNFLDTLSLVAVNFDGYRDVDDPGICDNRTLRFNVVAGTSYRIQMRSLTGAPFLLQWNYADPPPNDNFANALILAGNSGSITGTNKDATKEPGERNHAGGTGGASVWYRWTAPVSGEVTFDTIGFRNQSPNLFRYLTSLIAVYTGASFNSLTEVVANASQNKVVFNATAGTTYHIAVDSGPYQGGGFLPGTIPLHWGTKQVANDDFANAQPLSATAIFSPLLGSNAGATKEIGEPNHLGRAGGTSVWYRWTALTNSNATFVFNHCTPCNFFASNAVFAVYTGASVNALTPVPTSGDLTTTSFSASRGKTYFIVVDSVDGTGGTYEFSLVSSTIPPPNDLFSKAQAVSGNAGAVAGDNAGATKENNEPKHANDFGGASVWYVWRAPASGLVTFDTFGSSFDTLLAVYTGNAVNLLSTVASNDNTGSSKQSRVSFDARVFTIYFIAVDGKRTGVDTGTGLSLGETAFIHLNWNNLPPPLNDNFANAQVIAGGAGEVSGRNTVASKEGGEPDHAGNPGGVSVWYRWTAPATAKVTFNTFGSDVNTLLGVYTGNSVNALTLVSTNDDVGALTQSRVNFNAVAGTVYHIAVDGSVGVPGTVTRFAGNLVLSWFPELDGGNDSFALAQTLIGRSGSVAGTNTSASKESGEPNHAGDRGGRSLWHSWTAPFSGPVLFTTAGSDFDTVLAVYTGTSVSGLTLVAGNDDSPYADNLTHTLTSSLTFNATAGTTYRIAVDGSGGRFGSFALRWGPEAKISGLVAFLAGFCGSDKKVSVILSGEDARVLSFTGSGTFSFEHLRVGGNYSVRGVTEGSASCQPLFLERARSFFQLTGDILNADFIDDGLRGAGSTSNITGRVTNAGGLGMDNVTITLSGTASRTVYTESQGFYQLPSLPDGTYQVTPSKAGVIFSPTQRSFTFDQGQSVPGNFVAPESYNIGGQTRNVDGSAISDVTVTLTDGTQSFTTQSNSSGYYSFDAMAGGSYTLTAANAGLNFTPVDTSFANLSANQHNIDFTNTAGASTPAGQNVSVQMNGVTVTFTSVTSAGNTNVRTISPGTAGTLPNGYQLTGNSLAFDISTNAVVQPPITVCFNVPAITDPMEFAQLRVLHSETGVLVDRTSSHDFTTKMICATVDSLSVFLITLSNIQLLMDESGPAAGQAAALDAVLLFRDPFAVVNAANPFKLSSDPNTRVLIFVRNLKLASGETGAAVTVNLVDASNQNYEIAAEDVSHASGFDFGQVRFRLPDALAPGVCTIQVRAHGQMTNLGTVHIKL